MTGRLYYVTCFKARRLHLAAAVAELLRALIRLVDGPKGEGAGA